MESDNSNNTINDTIVRAVPVEKTAETGIQSSDDNPVLSIWSLSAKLGAKAALFIGDKLATAGNELAASKTGQEVDQFLSTVEATGFGKWTAPARETVLTTEQATGTLIGQVLKNLAGE